MQYHWGILRQQGHGLGGLLRLAAPVMKNVMSDLVGRVFGGGGPWSPPYYPSSRNYYPPPPPLPSFEYSPERSSPPRRRSRRRHPRPQKGKGFLTYLLKSTAKQALTAAAKTGLDVLENKRSFKDALKTHGGQVIKNTTSHILSQGGDKSRPPAKPKLLDRGGPRIKRPLETASGERPPNKKKKARPLDIFD